jgi:hypothetical protein
MYPKDYASLINEANTGKPQTFLLYDRSIASALDTGILNFFQNEQGRTDCTVGETVFSSQGQYGQFVWPEDVGSISDRRDLPRFPASTNFWSCALFPNITQAFRNSMLSPENRTYLLENNVNTTENTSAAVTSFISTCLSSWCRESYVCETSSCDVERLKVGDAMLSAASLDTCLDHLCSPTPSISSNPDIGGIGVITSYYIQFGLVLAALLSLTLWPLLLSWTRSQTARQSNVQCVKDELSPPPVVLEGVKETIFMAVDEFQRTQCTFAIAINVASLITLQLNAQTLSFLDRRAMVAASASGTLPTTLVLAALMASNKQHLDFTFWITFSTWVISLSVGLHPQIFRYKDVSSDYLTKFPGVCGKSPPVNVCRTGLDVLQTAPSLFPIAIATMIALTWWKIKSARITAILWSMWPWKMSHDRFAPYRVTSIQGRFLLLSIVGITGVAYLYFLLFVTQIINDPEWIVDWSFGQIVTISGWLPAVLILLNRCIYGSRQEHMSKLAENLQVPKIESLA